MRNNLTIVPDSDYRKLSAFWKGHGLEVTVTDVTPENVLGTWSVTDADGTLVAAAALEVRNGYFVLADVAVDSAYRGQHWGVSLVQLVEREAAQRGGTEIWLAGKVPVFYEKLGWSRVAREDAPDVSKCLRCEDFQVTCYPEIMRKGL